MQSIQLRNLIQTMPVLTGDERPVLLARTRAADHFGVRPSSIYLHGIREGEDFVVCAIDAVSGGMIVEYHDAAEFEPGEPANVAEFTDSVFGMLRIA